MSEFEFFRPLFVVIAFSTCEIPATTHFFVEWHLCCTFCCRSKLIIIFLSFFCGKRPHHLLCRLCLADPQYVQSRPKIRIAFPPNEAVPFFIEPFCRCAADHIFIVWVPDG